VVPSSFGKYVIPFFVHMNLKLFSFLNRKHWFEATTVGEATKHWLKRRRYKAKTV